MEAYKHVEGFMALYDGLKTAFGTGEGRWVKRPPTKMDFVAHLLGEGPGIGIGPLRPDNTVMFAAIDLDEPDFDAAREMQKYVPGTSWVERSRSGNAHVLVFFAEPVEAWLPMALLREACVAAGKPRVEVFPKNHDFAKVKLGNYINAAYHGGHRPVLHAEGHAMSLGEFVVAATESRQDPEEWRKRARWLMLSEPQERERTSEFGSAKNLHMCAEYIIGRAISGENPIVEGHRALVYFSLAKMLLNWEGCDEAEALGLLRDVNEASPDPFPDSELVRTFRNAVRGQFTSTGCDDPVMAPYTHPNCPIVRNSR